MTVRVIICCDGAWHGFPCRGSITVRSSPARGSNAARAAAHAHGWSTTPADDPAGQRDLCPAHTRDAAR